MIDPWFKLTLLMLVAGTIGYLAQRSGLCMIRGVAELRAGRPTLLLAMLLCGICVWAFVPLANYWHINIPHVRYQWHVLFVLGGLVFGLGTSANGGCSVSTMSRLARGDFHMLATMIGWIIGWCLWLAWAPSSEHLIRLGPTPTSYMIAEFLLLATASFWAIRHSAANRRLWLTIMGIGLMSGLLFLLQPQWSPSDMVQHLTTALLHGSSSAWPDSERYLLLLALLAGMLVAAWLGHSFVLMRFSLKRVALHLIAGTAMGVGAAMVMGGNDLQLLLTLPAASPAALVTVASMLVGIYIGVLLKRPLKRVGQLLGAD